MAYRVDEIEIPPEAPFAHDVLDRKPVVEFLAGLVGRLDGPFVLAIDSPWGTGKTTLVRMLAAELGRQDFQCVEFNAWKVDYYNDPLVALVSSVDRVSLGDGSASAAFEGSIGKAKKVAGILAKRSLIAAAKVATFGIIDAEKEFETAGAELAGNSAGDLFEAFEREQRLLVEFRENLAAAVSQLPSAGKKPNLVFFVDELDRCRPSFAIELLERVKHLFDVPGIVFVLSIDKRQLEAITAAVYGQGIDAREYLRRFIDLEMGIPAANSKLFTNHLIGRFGLDPVFAGRRGRDTSYDKDNFVDFFTALADAMGLTLRARERCLTMLKLVMDQTPDDHYLHPVLVALLIVLRAKEPETFRKVVDGRASPRETMEFLRAKMSPSNGLDERYFVALEAYLVHTDPADDRRKARNDELRKLASDESADDAARYAAKELLDMIHSVGSGMRVAGRISVVAAKIDLAAMVRD